MSTDADLSVMGASLVACMVTVLVMIWNESFGGVNAAMFYVVAALSVGYASFGANRPIGNRAAHVRS